MKKLCFYKLSKLKKLLLIFLSCLFFSKYHDAFAFLGEMSQPNLEYRQYKKSKKDGIDSVYSVSNDAQKYNNGLIRFSRGLYSSASTEFLSIIDESVDSPIEKEAFFMYILCIFLDGDYEETMIQSDKFIRRYPTDANVSYIKNINLIASTKMLMGEYIAMDRLDRAKNMAQQLLNNRSHKVKSHRDRALFYLDLINKAKELNFIRSAQTNYKHRKFASALSMYNQMFEFESDEHRRMGMLMSYECLSRLGLTDLANEYLKYYIEDVLR